MFNADIKIPLNDILITVFIFLLMGFVIGRTVPLKLGYRLSMVLQKVYLRPDSQKDIKTIIIESTGKDLIKYQNQGIRTNNKCSIYYN